jgi:GNAT superfamily N-acetyltransferase
MGKLKQGVQPFDPAVPYKTDSFDCGRPVLDDFLKQHLAKQQQNHVLRGYVIQTDDPGQQSPEILGYYTLSGGCYTKAGMSNGRRKQVPYRDAPCILLGRLAVDKRLAGNGFGAILVADAARRTYEAAQSVGVYALMAEAKDEEAAKFYEAMGFTKLATEDGRLIYFYPTSTIGQLIDKYPPLP